VLLTGAKLLTATDFASPDGDLALVRLYRSRGGVASVDRAPVGLGLGWRFSFQHELAIDASFASSGRVSLKTADGASYDFRRQSDGSMAAIFAASSNGARNTDYQLAFEGAWPADLNLVRTMKTRWRVVDPRGATWILESFSQPGLSAAFEVARPVSLTRGDGYGQSFAYGPLSELQSLTDSFGRQITFTWHYAMSYSGLTEITYPAALATASLPGGSRIGYGYEALAAADAPARPERLVRVGLTDASGTLLDSTAYLHEDARFPAFVTGIVDGRGVRTLTVSYDGRGRAVSSALAEGAEAVTVAYGEAETPVTTRTVTNALGKQTIYRFRATGSGAFRLEGVDGLASAHCTGSTKAFTYDTNGWVQSTTDEEGEVTSFVRDARGLPTTMTRSHP
jgi:YD repeat-containing protein